MVVAKASRDKGKRGELEVCKVFRAAGIEAHRTAALQAGRVPGAADVSLPYLPLLHVEVKRDERLSVDAMVRQADAEAPELATPIVAWRRNGGEWRADVPLEWLAELLGAGLSVLREAHPLLVLRTDTGAVEVAR